MAQTTTEEWFADGLSFTCTQCGNCCTGSPGYVWFDDDEAEDIAAYLDLTTQQFRDRLAHTIDGRWTLNERANGRDYDCVFLKRDEQGKALCSIYPVRPKQCRTWPFWPENLSNVRAWQRAGRNCPGMNHGTFYPVEKIRIIRDATPL